VRYGDLFSTSVPKPEVGGSNPLGDATPFPWRDVAVPEVYIGARLGRMQAGVSSLGFSDDLYSVVVNVGASRAALFGALCAFATGLWVRYRS
jgi:hypothetical protein